MKGKLAKALLAIAAILALLILLPDPHTSANRFSAKMPSGILEKRQMPPLLDGNLVELVHQGKALVEHPSLGKVHVRSTVDAGLQEKAEKLLKGQRSLRAAVALVDAHSGRVLVLAGAKGQRLDPEPGPGLHSSGGLAVQAGDRRRGPGGDPPAPRKPDALLRPLHTRCTAISSRTSCAAGSPRSAWPGALPRATTPVFGRIGALRLGQDLLTRYALQLGFEQELSFELPLGQSELLHPEDKYALAEMASGFNRTTSLSPLHAALLVSAFVNGGRLAQPYLVDQAYDQEGKVVYVGRPHLGPPVVSPKTCQHMRQLFAGHHHLRHGPQGLPQPQQGPGTQTSGAGRQDRHHPGPEPQRAVSVVCRLRPGPP